MKQQGRQQLLSWIQTLHTECSNVHLLITSRSEHDIKSACEGWERVAKFISLMSELIQQDISSYVHWEVQEGRRLCSMAGTGRCLARDRRCTGQRKPKGCRFGFQSPPCNIINPMYYRFRWVSYQIDELEQCLDYGQVQESLR
jgi:hypothetical protein